MKKFSGNVVGEVIATRDGWSLCKRGISPKGWISYKLVANQPMQAKANYWFAWSPGEKRFSRSKDVILLERHRPDLLTWVTHELGGVVPGKKPHYRVQELDVTDSSGEWRLWSVPPKDEHANGWRAIGLAQNGGPSLPTGLMWHRARREWVGGAGLPATVREWVGEVLTRREAPPAMPGA